MLYILFCIINSGAINGLYSYIIGGLFFLFPFQLLKRRKIYVNMIKQSSFIMLFFFGVSYSFIGRDLRYIEYYFLCPLLAYIMGWVIVENCKISRAYFIKNIIYSVVLGYGVHAILNLSINRGNLRWELIDFYTKSIRSATGSGVLNTLCFSLIMYLIVIEYSKFIKIIGFGIIFFSIWYALILGTRTQFIILILVNSLVFLLYYHETSKLRKKMKYLFFISVILGICGYLFINNKFGIKDAFWSSNLAVRFLDVGTKSSDLDRKSRYLLGIFNMLEYPFGGLIFKPYYHNLWLDIGRISGIIPFVFMSVYSFIINKHMLKVFLKKINEKEIRFLILAVYMGVQLNFFVEPVLEGMNEFFLCFCFINGMSEAYYWHEHRINIRKIIKRGEK